MPVATPIIEPIEQWPATEVAREVRSNGRPDLGLERLKLARLKRQPQSRERDFEAKNSALEREQPEKRRGSRNAMVPGLAPPSTSTAQALRFKDRKDLAQQKSIGVTL